MTKLTGLVYVEAANHITGVNLQGKITHKNIGKRQIITGDYVRGYLMNLKND